MTAPPHIVHPTGLLGEAPPAEASPPDLMRSRLQNVINTLLPPADADAITGAEYGRPPSPGQSAQRNGYRHRDIDARVGTIDVAIPPELRTGTCFPNGCSNVASAPSPH